MEMSVLFWRSSARTTTDFHCGLDVNECTMDPCPQNTSCGNKVNDFLCQDCTTFVCANEGQSIDAVDKLKCNCLNSLFGLTYDNKETFAQIIRRCS